MFQEQHSHMGSLLNSGCCLFHILLAGMERPTALPPAHWEDPLSQPGAAALPCRSFQPFQEMLPGASPSLNRSTTSIVRLRYRLPIFGRWMVSGFSGMVTSYSHLTPSTDILEYCRVRSGLSHFRSLPQAFGVNITEDTFMPAIPSAAMSRTPITSPVSVTRLTGNGQQME